MPTVDELSAPYGNFMLNPLSPQRPDVCSICTTFTDGWPTCFRCGHDHQFADAVLCTSYSPAFGQLHTALQQYKRAPRRIARPVRIQLAAVLWRFLLHHEPCLAQATGVASFDLATTVPSSSQDRDDHHPLRHMVAQIIRPTAGRHRRLLVPSRTPVAERAVDPGKFNPTANLDGESVLLIDDTWTTGASVQSAAAALKVAGASRVGVVIIGRHVNDYRDNVRRLEAVPRPFDWTTCALHVSG